MGVGQLLAQKYAMLYKSNIIFEKLLYGSIRKINKMGACGSSGRSSKLSDF